MTGSPAPSADGAALAFGPFRFIPSGRVLLHGDEPLRLGTRSREILHALIEHAGSIVEKRKLIEWVWPLTSVEEGALRVHIAALRKALGDGKAGARYIQNVHGVGYRFIAPVTRIGEPSLVEIVKPPDPDELPVPLNRMVGRTQTLCTLLNRLPQQRLMTIVGPGGIGKSTVAVAAADSLRGSYAHGVRYIDIADVSHASLFGCALAAALGIGVISKDPIPGIVTRLRDKRVLIVLDNCEHLVRAVAHLTERLLNDAPGVHILATSRQPLRARNEWLLRLDPLEFPRTSAALSASEALRFPAIQLFVDRAHASLDTFELDDVDSPVVAEICHRLDGLPLAIELAAAHVDVFGIRGLLARIDTDLGLWTPERNSIRPRHQTLNATLDWSYNLLSESERTALHRLAVFVGTFSLEAAQSVTTRDLLDCERALEAIGSLVAKSLVAVEIGKPEMHYRLLDTTRAYALRKLLQSGEYGVIAQHHAIYYRDLLERVEQGHAILSYTAGPARCSEHLSNVRAALEWSLSPTGDTGIGTALAAAAARCLLDASLLTECRVWMERSLAVLDTAYLGTRREMEIRAALALSLMFTQGNGEDVRTALTQALDLAQQFKDPVYEIRLYSALHIFLLRRAEFHESLILAQRGEAVARSIADPAGNMIADSMLGISHHLIGHQASAQALCEAALSQPQLSRHGGLMSCGYDHRIRTLVTLTRALWLRGYADRAVKVAYQTLAEAAAFDHPVSLCFGLIYTGSVMLWVGNWAVAAEIIDRVLAHAEKHSLAPYHAVGRGMKAGLALRCGEARAASELLSACLQTLDADRHRILTAVFVGDLAESLGALGRLNEAFAVIDEALARSAHEGQSFHTPELYRIRGQLLSLQPRFDPSEVEIWLTRALNLARRQAALAWELRAALALARLWCDLGRRNEARKLLGGVYDRFTEGFETADVVAARRLLLEMERMPASSTQAHAVD